MDAVTEPGRPLRHCQQTDWQAGSWQLWLADGLAGRQAGCHTDRRRCRRRLLKDMFERNRLWRWL